MKDSRSPVTCKMMFNVKLYFVGVYLKKSSTAPHLGYNVELKLVGTVNNDKQQDSINKYIYLINNIKI